MKILALDSSGLTASVAVIEDENLMGEYTMNYKKTHSQTLLPMLDEVAKMIELLPAADVAEVKHGKWIEVQKENIWNDIVPVLECSACGKYTVGTRGIMTKSNYCPNCGAKMNLED